MPKATLTYDLADPDEDGLHKIAVAAPQLTAALHGIDEFCRSAIKHGDHSHETVRLLEEIRSMMPPVMWEY